MVNVSINHMFVFCDKAIETTVTAMASVADDWVRNNIRKHHREHKIVGFDCKFKHHPIKSMSSKIATLQLCADTKCLILQLLYMDNIPISVTKLLLDQCITFVGVEIKENARKLWSEYGLKCDKYVDIRSLVKIWFPISSYRKRPSLKAMAYALAGLPMRKSKTIAHCDWESTSLDKEFIEYASVDAFVCYKIAYSLLNQL